MHPVYGHHAVHLGIGVVVVVVVVVVVAAVCIAGYSSMGSCIFAFAASVLHPNMSIPNSPSSFTTCFYQLFSQSATERGRAAVFPRGS